MTQWWNLRELVRITKHSILFYFILFYYGTWHIESHFDILLNEWCCFVYKGMTTYPSILGPGGKVHVLLSQLGYPSGNYEYLDSTVCMCKINMLKNRPHWWGSIFSLIVSGRCAVEISRNFRNNFRICSLGCAKWIRWNQSIKCTIHTRSRNWSWCRIIKQC